MKWCIYILNKIMLFAIEVSLFFIFCLISTITCNRCSTVLLDFPYAVSCNFIPVSLHGLVRLNQTKKKTTPDLDLFPTVAQKYYLSQIIIFVHN